MHTHITSHTHEPWSSWKYLSQGNGRKQEGQVKKCKDRKQKESEEQGFMRCLPGRLPSIGLEGGKK